MMKKLAAGIIAHVDAGKTTLSEALLFGSGMIRKQGRVDKKDTYLDTHELERARGITIFSKQAIIDHGGVRITLLDTPGHVDFSGETERTMSVMDCAVLVVSGSEMVQAHTETLWRLLGSYSIPTFIFVTKMDISTYTHDAVMSNIEKELSHSCVDFTYFSGEDKKAVFEKISVLDEEALDGYIENGTLTDGFIADMVKRRKLFPCFFGSGLKNDGVAALLDALEKYALSVPDERKEEEFGARVFKIGRDKNGARLSFLKVTSGKAAVRSEVTYSASGEEFREKISGIRFYSGEKYETADSAEKGDVCAVTGLTAAQAGTGLGIETGAGKPSLGPVLNYRVTLPPDVDPRTAYPKLKLLEEEEPLLGVVWNERFSEIHVCLMGHVQTEVLAELIRERFDMDVSFDGGSIMYKETVSSSAEGVGHFEPLRHYAEVHLLIEKGERGSGSVFESVCDTGVLEKNLQRLVLTHLEEKQHAGVLTGSPLTDVKITLTAGKAHKKHTQGGDFREATYRAVRQGLMRLRERGETVLLEPFYSYRLEVPGECTGRAVSDIISFSGTYTLSDGEGGSSVLTGLVPVSEAGAYAAEVASYSRGRGKFSCAVDGYYPCHNAGEVIERYAYDPESDAANTPDSVFCARGAGFTVKWDAVEEYMDVPATVVFSEKDPESYEIVKAPQKEKDVLIEEKELEEIMNREFGPIRRKQYGDPKKPYVPPETEKKYGHKKTLSIIDGYNLIFAWKELSDEAKTSLEDARGELLEILANYRAYTGRDIIVVFDAYNVKEDLDRKAEYHGVKIVYTKEKETADAYIERLVSEIGSSFNVRCVTSDGLIQLQALRSGVMRMSAREFREEVLAVDAEIGDILKKIGEKNKKTTIGEIAAGNR